MVPPYSSLLDPLPKIQWDPRIHFLQVNATINYSTFVHYQNTVMKQMPGQHCFNVDRSPCLKRLLIINWLSALVGRTFNCFLPINADSLEACLLLTVYNY